MKIKSVDIQPHHHHPEDGTNSTSSIEDAPPIDYENTVTSLTQALTELHMELRYRTSENEALLATASSLSDSLKESDRLLQDKSLECEHLQLKLQMVTFIERNDESLTSLLDGSDHDPDVLHDSWTSEIEESIPADMGKAESSTANATMSNKPRKKKSSSSTTNKENLSTSSEKPSKSVNAASGSDSNKKNHSAVVKVSSMGPVSVDDFDESSPDIGPRQAHFYNVMLERDKALSSAKKLKKELSYAKGKAKELQAKLDKSNLLVEISYEHQEEEKKKQRKPQLSLPDKLTPSEPALSRRSDTQEPESSSSSPSSSLSPSSVTEQQSRKAMTRQWLRKAGVSARKKEMDGDNSFQTLVTDDEKLSSKWHNKFQGSKNEAAYLDAITGNDADRAGGHEFIRFQL
jgi:hypothetical protein